MIDTFLIYLNRAFDLNLFALAVMVAGIAFGVRARRRFDAAMARAAAIGSRRGTTGGEAAAEILAATELDGVPVEPGRWPFPDLYDPTTRVLHLAPATLDGHSLAALGLAAHEAGHALQHARRDPPMPLLVRDALAQAIRIVPGLTVMLVVVGFVLDIPKLTTLGMVALGLSFALPLVGLPIERDASRRGRRALAMTALVGSDQDDAVTEVLDALAWHEVAAVLPRLRRPRWRSIEPGPPTPRPTPAAHDRGRGLRNRN